MRFKFLQKSALCLGSLIVFQPQFTRPSRQIGADRLVGIQSARVMSQSLPWIADEARLFQKYKLDFQLVYIASSGMATAAILGGDAEVALTGGVGFVRAFVSGAPDIVFIGGVKNVMTQSILAGAEIKRVEDLKRQKSGRVAASVAIRIILPFKS